MFSTGWFSLIIYYKRNSETNMIRKFVVTLTMALKRLPNLLIFAHYVKLTVNVTSLNYTQNSLFLINQFITHLIKELSFSKRNKKEAFTD